MSLIQSALRGGSARVASGPGSNSIADIISQLESAQKKANDANLARYNQGLQELETGRESMRNYFAQANSLIQDIGASAVEDISRGAQRSFAQNKQHLISAGLHNTTIMGSLIRGTEEDRRREMERVEEQRRVALGGLAERQASAELGASGNIAQFIAARSDVGPDIGQYAGLIQQAAAAPQGKVQARIGAGGGGVAGAGSPGFSSFGERPGTVNPANPAYIVTKGGGPQTAAQFQASRRAPAPPPPTQATGRPAAPGQQQRTFKKPQPVGSYGWESAMLGGGGRRGAAILESQTKSAARAGGPAPSGSGYIKPSGGGGGFYTTNQMKGRPRAF